MMTDPIVDQVRAIRDEIAKECNYDIDTIFQRLRSEAGSSIPRVSLPARKVSELDPEDGAPTKDAA